MFHMGGSHQGEGLLAPSRWTSLREGTCNITCFPVLMGWIDVDEGLGKDSPSNNPSPRNSTSSRLLFLCHDIACKYVRGWCLCYDIAIHISLLAPPWIPKTNSKRFFFLLCIWPCASECLAHCPDQWTSTKSWLGVTIYCLRATHTRFIFSPTSPYSAKLKANQLHYAQCHMWICLSSFL